MSIKAYNITLNGKVYQVEVEEVQPGQKPVQTAAPAPKAAPVVNGAGEDITAPMPGSMFNILVKEGQAVKKGDVVAILEAMKMENEIVAPNDGTVKAINTSKGASVSVGDVLITLG